MRNALDYGKAACETMIRHCAAPELKPVGRFHYHQGVFLSGMEKLYELTGDERYAEYIKAWVDSIITPEGVISNYDPTILDDLQPGILLFGLYDRTGDERYKTALDTISEHLRNWKKNEYGGMQHRFDFRHNQMWLDSLYMGGPIQAEYGRRYNEPMFCDEAAKQAVIMKEHIQDKNTGLMRHAWDPSKRAMWCDPVTGLAPECWGRALGWYVVAVIDIIEQLPENHGERERLSEIEREIIEAIARYQERETGMWYQVVNMGNRPDNWLETSCTALFAYAMAKGVRLGVLDEKYLYRAFHAFYGITDIAVDRFRDELLVQRVCIGTGVGTYNYYTNRPQSTNDLHGVGVFLLLCAELAKHERK